MGQQNEYGDGLPPLHRPKNRVLVAMNYVLVAVILLGIGLVLFKEKSSNEPLTITGSSPVDVWCQTHASQEDCRAECTNLSFDEYTRCVGDCLKKVDACKHS